MDFTIKDTLLSSVKRLEIKGLRFSQMKDCGIVYLNPSEYTLIAMKYSRDDFSSHHICELKICEDTSNENSDIIVIRQEVLQATDEFIKYRIDCDEFDIHEVFEEYFPRCLGGFIQGSRLDIYELLNNLCTNYKSCQETGFEFLSNVHPYKDYIYFDTGTYLNIRAGLCRVVFRVKEDGTLKLACIERFSRSWLLSVTINNISEFSSEHSGKDYGLQFSFPLYNEVTNLDSNFGTSNRLVRDCIGFIKLFENCIDFSYHKKFNFCHVYDGIDFSSNVLMNNIIISDDDFLSCIKGYKDIAFDYLRNLSIDDVQRVKAQLCGLSGGYIASVKITDDFKIETSVTVKHKQMGYKVCFI